MNHEQPQIHKIHHDPNLGKATTFPLIIYFVHGHGTNTQMSFCHGTPKWEFRNSQSWDSRNSGTHNFMCRPWIEISYGLGQELFNGMLHATYTQGNWDDSRFLVVGSQTANLTPDLFFGHNLCHNPNLGLATKARGLQGCEPKGKLMSHLTCSWECKECDGMNPHIPK
jgi:hypothetical protein